MDTKLKNNNLKLGVLTFIIIIAATLGFMGLFPVFERMSNERKININQEHFFLSKLSSFNYVLYQKLEKQVNESLDNNSTYADLYLDVTYGNDKKPHGYNEYFTDSDLSVGIDDISDMLNNEMRQRENIFNSVYEIFDYFALDDTNNQFFGNNENTAKGYLKDKKSYLDTHYKWYILMYYDGSGKMQISGSKDITNTDPQYYTDIDAEHSFSYKIVQSVWEDDENMQSEVAYTRFIQPDNTVFFYGITEEQYPVFSDKYSNLYRTFGYYDNGIRHNYQGIGIEETFLLFLVALSLLAILLPRIARVSVKGKRKLPAEIGFLVICALLYLLYAATDNFISLLVAGSYYPEYIKQAESYFGTIGHEVLLFISGVIIFLIFGLSFLTVGAFAEITEMNPIEFLKRRSLIIRLIMFIINKLKHGADRILHDPLEKKYKLRIIAIAVFLFICSFIVMVLGAARDNFYVLIAFLGSAFGLAFMAGLSFGWLRKVVSQYNTLLDVNEAIATGDMDAEFPETGGVFGTLIEKQQRIRVGIREAVTKGVASERVKTELITNVSHDLKTPLTALVTYIELLKKEGITEEERASYIEVLDKKTEKLKLLIEDLFQTSQAVSGSLAINAEELNIVDLLRQVAGEMSERLETSNILFKWTFPEEKIMLSLDGQKTCRIFENLLLNIVKYAMEGTRAYVSISENKEARNVIIEFKNISAAEITVSPDDLTDRFVRGDDSRNTDGHGLGLAIVKSFTELQGGTFEVSLDGDLFKATVKFRLTSP